MHWSEWPTRDTNRVRGYVYVLRFTSGAVKIGHTQNPRQRAHAHRVDAARYGLAITDAWLSPDHTNYRDTERALVAELPKLGRLLAVEYVAAPFADVVAAAERLDYQLVPTLEQRLTLLEQRRTQRDDEIRRAYAEEHSIRRVAHALGVSKSHVARVVSA